MGLFRVRRAVLPHHPAFAGAYRRPSGPRHLVVRQLRTVRLVFSVVTGGGTRSTASCTTRSAKAAAVAGRRSTFKASVPTASGKTGIRRSSITANSSTSVPTSRRGRAKRLERRKRRRSPPRKPRPTTSCGARAGPSRTAAAKAFRSWRISPGRSNKASFLDGREEPFVARDHRFCKASSEAFTRVCLEPRSYFWTRIGFQLVDALVNGQGLSQLASDYATRCRGGLPRQPI